MKYAIVIVRKGWRVKIKLLPIEIRWAADHCPEICTIWVKP